MSIKKGSMCAPVSAEFIKDLVRIMLVSTENRADTFTFILPKLSGMEQDGNMEVTISWRFLKNET